MAQTPGGFHALGMSTVVSLELKADFTGTSYQPEAPRVFVVSWLDYCTKYGMGFAMADGTVSVHFNDSSSLVLAPGKMYVLILWF
jgi:polo-like kinase 1